MTAVEDICVKEYILFVKANNVDIIDNVMATPVIFSSDDSSNPAYAGEVISLPNSPDYSPIKVAVEPCFRMEQGDSAVFGLRVVGSSVKTYTMKTVQRDYVHNQATVATISDKGVSLVSTKHNELDIDFAIMEHATAVYEKKQPVTPTNTVAATATATTEVAKRSVEQVEESWDVDPTDAPTTPQPTTTTEAPATTTEGPTDGPTDAPSTPEATTTTTQGATTEEPTSTTTVPIVEPVVTSSSMAPTAGGYITITGLHFGADNTVIVVSIDNNTCSDVSLPTTDTAIRCYVGAGTGRNKHVVVLANGVQNSDTNTAFHRIAPNVTGISLSGTTISVQGSNFGSNADVVTVTAGTINCPVTVASETVIACSVPTDANLNSVVVDGKVTVSLAVDGQAATGTLTLGPGIPTSSDSDVNAVASVQFSSSFLFFPLIVVFASALF